MCEKSTSIHELTSVHAKTPFVVVFDCESDAAFKNVAGMDRVSKLSRMQCTLACATVVDSARLSATGKNYHFWRHESADGKPPFHGLLWLFDHAEVIVAFNALDFDFPLLRKHYDSKERYLQHRMKTLDPFSRIRAVTDKWPKLETLLQANGLASKSGDGLQAIVLFEEGKYKELKAYCEDDVTLLLELCLLPRVVLPDVGPLPQWLTSISVAVSASRDADFVMV